MNGLGITANGLSPLIIELHSVYTFFDYTITGEENYYRDFLNSIMRQICFGCAETAYIRMKAEQEKLVFGGVASFEASRSYIRSMMMMLKNYLK